MSDFPLDKQMHVILSDISMLAQSNYTDGRSSTALFFVLVDSIHRNVLASVGIEVGHHSLVSEPNFGTIWNIIKRIIVLSLS